MAYTPAHGSRRRPPRGKHHQYRMPVLAGLLVFCLIVGFVIVFVVTSGSAVVVPDVVGLSFAQARQKAKEAKLKMRVSPLQDTTGIEDLGELEVLKQEPRAGIEQFEGFLITVSLDKVPGAAVVRSEAGAEPQQSAPEAAQTSSPPAQPTQPGASSAPPAPPPAPALVFPLEGKPLYPFTKDGSISCGQWNNESQDYPYFGAPRDGNTRTHAGIDIYPPGREGAPVKAMKAGTVLKIAPFYTRVNGEITYGVLIDHGDFVANYAELKPPAVTVGAAVAQGQVIGQTSGTEQLHFEQYAPSTTDWTHGWYGDRPPNLLDPTETILKLL